MPLSWVGEEILVAASGIEKQVRDDYIKLLLLLKWHVRANDRLMFIAKTASKIPQTFAENFTEVGGISTVLVGFPGTLWKFHRLCLNFQVCP